jgi:hypothetical protein
VRDANLLRGSAGVANVLYPAAGSAGAKRSVIWFRVEAQGDANYLVTLLVEQGGGDGGINSPGHGDENTFCHRSSVSSG